MAEVYEPRRRRSWGRRILITLIVLLVIAAIVLVVADRVGKSYAERVISDKVAEQVKNQGATSDKPDVDIEGFPFVTQVLRGRYDEIKIDLANFSGPAAQNDNTKIKVPLLDIRAKDVQAPINAISSGGNIVAGTVTGTGTLSYQQVIALVNQPGLTMKEQGGKLVGSAKVTALGQTFTVTGNATLSVSGGAIVVRFANVDSPDLPNIPAIKSIIAAYADKLGVTLQVPALPLKLKLQKVQPEASGLQFTAGASDVTLNSSGV